MEKTNEITKAIDQLEQKHLEMFSMLWDLKFGGHTAYKPEKNDSLKQAVKMLAERFKKVERLANYTPKVLGQKFESRKSGIDVESDDRFIKETQPTLTILKGLTVSQTAINGVRFTIYTDGYRQFVKGADYENAIKERFSDVSAIKTQDVLTVADVAFMLRVNGIN